MSDFSPILVLQIKICIKPDRHGKGSKKSEKLSPFGGIFSIMEQFDSNLSSVIDSTLGMRCRPLDYKTVCPPFPFLNKNGVQFKLQDPQSALKRLTANPFCSSLSKNLLNVSFWWKRTLVLPSLFSMPMTAKWVRTSRQYVLNIYSCKNAYADVFQNDFG